MTKVKVRFGQTSLLQIVKPAKEVDVMIQWIVDLVPMKHYEALTYSTKQMKMIKIRTSTPLMIPRIRLLAVDKYTIISLFNRKMKMMMTKKMTQKRTMMMVDLQVHLAPVEPIKQHQSISVVENLMSQREWKGHTGIIHDPLNLASSMFAGTIKRMSQGSWSAQIFSSRYQRCFQYT